MTTVLLAMRSTVPAQHAVVNNLKSYPLHPTAAARPLTFQVRYGMQQANGLLLDRARVLAHAVAPRHL
jgi:hypothetical protein